MLIVNIISLAILLAISYNYKSKLDIANKELTLFDIQNKFPELPILNIINTTENYKLKNVIILHLDKTLINPCSIQTNNDYEWKSLSDESEFFYALAEILCPPSYYIIPNSCKHDKEFEIIKQWSRLLHKIRIPSILKSKECSSTSISTLYIQQLQNKQYY